MAGLVHVVCAALLPDLDAAALESARALALELAEAPAATAVVVGESPTHLLVATWLESRDALELFAASPAHMAFIMRGVARVTSGMWSAAAETDGPPPAPASVRPEVPPELAEGPVEGPAYLDPSKRPRVRPLEVDRAESAETAPTLFVFGLRASEGPQLYEWEVRALLDGISALPGAAAAGPTFEERDRFRAAGVVVIPALDQEVFIQALAAATERSGGAAQALEHALAPVVGMRRSSRPRA